MSNFNDFADWLWSRDPHLASRIQDHHDHYRRSLAKSARPTTADNQSFIVDNYWHVKFTPHGLALRSLEEHNSPLIAYFQSSASLFAEILMQSVRRTGAVTLDEYTAEFTRLSAHFRQAWQQATGEQP